MLPKFGTPGGGVGSENCEVTAIVTGGRYAVSLYWGLKEWGKVVSDTYRFKDTQISELDRYGIAY